MYCPLNDPRAYRCNDDWANCFPALFWNGNTTRWLKAKFVTVELALNPIEMSVGVQSKSIYLTSCLFGLRRASVAQYDAPSPCERALLPYLGDKGDEHGLLWAC